MKIPFAKKKLKNHGYKNAKEKSIFIFWAEKCVLGAHRWSKHQFFLFLASLDTQGPTIGVIFFA